MRMRTFLMVLFLIPALAHAGPYVFPMVPGSPGWSDLTMAERTAAMQVPEDTLAVMSTEDVYLTYITFPAWIEIGGYSSGHQQGFDNFRQKYNLVSALINRPDVINVAMEHYDKYMVDDTNEDDMDYQVAIDLTQILLNQYVIIDSLSIDEKRTILEKAVSIYNIKRLLPDSYWIFAQGPILIGRILLMEEYAPLMDAITADPDIKRLLDSGLGFFSDGPRLCDFAQDYLTSINWVEDHEPLAIDLQTAFPNPFNPATTISYVIPSAGQVSLTVYTITGQKVATLVDDVQDMGNHSVKFNGKELASGIYVYRLETNGRVLSRKMMLAK